MGFKTWANEEVLASSDVNNLLMKQAVIVCTSGTRPSSPPEGMLIYETDTDTYKGWDGSAWQEIFILNPPRAEVTRSSTLSIPTGGSQTVVTWQTSVYNYRSMWNSVTNPSRLTVPAGMGGLYHVGINLEYEAGSPGGDVGTRQAILLKNGVVVGRQTVPGNGTGVATRVEYSRLVSASAADYFEVAAFQNSGFAVNIAVAQTTPFLFARRVGPS
jgi:hypothetical protein